MTTQKTLKNQIETSFQNYLKEHPQKTIEDFINSEEIIWSFQDYYSCMGNITDEDKNICKEYDIPWQDFVDCYDVWICSGPCGDIQYSNTFLEESDALEYFNNCVKDGEKFVEMYLVDCEGMIIDLIQDSYSKKIEN